MTSHPLDHDHHHEHSTVPNDTALRVKALESLLVEKGLVDPAALDAIVETYEHKVGRATARVSSRGPGPIPPTEAGCSPTPAPRSASWAIRARRASTWSSSRTRRTCTTWSSARCAPVIPGRCSGLPPAWYKSAAYRSRAVIDPRGVLREFGLEVADDVEVRVWDTTAEVRYLVLPERPAGTEG